MRRLVVLWLVVLSACGSAAPSGAEIPRFDRDEFADRLEGSDRPTVVNVWGSWCVPCRTEAPLLAAAHRRHAGRVDFLGIDVEDTQSSAQAFVEEFSLEFPQLFDPEGEVREVMGGVGAPITYFVAAGGQVLDTHIGVLDEGRLAEGIDRLLAG